MSGMEFDLPEDLFGQLLDSDFEEISKEALTKSIPLVMDSVKRECAAVIGDKSRTDLVNSLKVWRKGMVKTRTDACMLGVSFTGKPSNKSKWASSSNGKSRTRTTTNNDIAWWLEHGNRHQPARPFMDKATANVEDKVNEAIQKAFNKKVGAK